MMEGVATAVLFAVNRSTVFCGPCKFPNMGSNVGNATQHGSSPVPEASPNKSNLSREDQSMDARPVGAMCLVRSRMNGN